jgi:hypothetical protein
VLRLAGRDLKLTSSQQHSPRALKYNLGSQAGSRTARRAPRAARWLRVSLRAPRRRVRRNARGLAADAARSFKLRPHTTLFYCADLADNCELPVHHNFPKAG